MVALVTTPDSHFDPSFSSATQTASHSFSHARNFRLLSPPSSRRPAPQRSPRSACYRLTVMVGSMPGLGHSRLGLAVVLALRGYLRLFLRVALICYELRTVAADLPLARSGIEPVTIVSQQYRVRYPLAHIGNLSKCAHVWPTYSVRGRVSRRHWRHVQCQDHVCVAPLCAVTAGSIPTF